MSLALAWNNPQRDTSSANTDFVEFIPQGRSLKEAHFFGGLPLNEQVQKTETGQARESSQKAPSYAAVQLPLDWSYYATQAARELQDAHTWTQGPYTLNDIKGGVSQRILLSGLRKSHELDNRPLIQHFANHLDQFLPTCYKKGVLITSVSNAALEFMRVANTRDIMVTFEAGPAHGFQFRQPEEQGLQAALSLTTAGFVIANPASVRLPDASEIAVECLPAFRAEVLARQAEHIRGGVLIAFQGLTKPAPVAYLAPAPDEGVSVRVRFQALPRSGSAYQKAPTLLQCTMDRFRTGPC